MSHVASVPSTLIESLYEMESVANIPSVILFVLSLLPHETRDMATAAEIIAAGSSGVILMGFIFFCYYVYCCSVMMVTYHCKIRLDAIYAVIYYKYTENSCHILALCVFNRKNEDEHLNVCGVNIIK